ncbi:probable protein phosphatase CG10417 [Orussus abietinus]|uniref:probable protein phosphatase CG10417 n=1 Tax=Orussus abietinus TaxID=222816 RepID=UPI000625C725|nr:probable protein phosphatase CG10417 [Orussus abietinus]
MGAYLSEPVTEKVSSDGSGENVAFGASSMQGWRVNQEDAHNCCIEFDESVSLFAVYDGHGGHEVAQYSADKLPEFIKNTEAYKTGDIKQALIDAFLGFDATLAKPEVVSILKEIAGTTNADGDKENSTKSDEEENVSNLCMEATMPLEQVMAKYQSEGTNPSIKALKGEKCGGKRVCTTSPYLRGRRTRDKAISSSGASCSSSSSSTSWNTNEADVSSSSQPCGSSRSVAEESKQQECIGSSEAEQVLDSTTSNGDIVHASQPVDSMVDTVPAKSADMPDSSEDVRDKVSPGEITTARPSMTAETNGEGSKQSFRDADSSKSGGDNVSSSSCIPLENGEAGQHERISSSKGRKWEDLETFRSRTSKRKKDDSSDDDDGEPARPLKPEVEEDDDSEETDETFDGVEESDDDDDDDTEDVEDENDSNDDDEDEDDDDDDDNQNDFIIDMMEEPGSDSGCTAVVAVLKGKDLYVANAGDSRCVLCRDGQALELSLDHKPEDQPEIQRIVKAGGKVTADGRVNGGLNLSRALGDHAYKQNTELPAPEQMISALPDIRHITLEPERDEFMILACDGIWNFMSSQDVIQFVRARLSLGHSKISKICEELFDLCLAPNTLGDGTGCDNMTAVIVQFKSIKPSNPTCNDVEPSKAKKRAVSPNDATKGNNSFSEEAIVEDSKRPKIEAV